MRITHIVSGGQTGADRGGLDVAIELGIPHGGWCPKGRKAEDGPIPDKYRLEEMGTDSYVARTEANVVNSDATIVFANKRATGGSLQTLEFCRKHGKPYLHIALEDVSRERAVEKLLAWLSGDPAYNAYEDYEARPSAECVLNVAGSRESESPGIRQQVRDIMLGALNATRRR